VKKEELKKFLHKKKTTRELSNKIYSYQDEIEVYMDTFLFRMNQLIIGTDAYKYSGFRFRPIIGSDVQVRLLIPYFEIHRKYKRDFYELAEEYNLRLDYDAYSGMYDVLPGYHPKSNRMLDGALWLKRLKYAYREYTYDARR
jgi:hypothetical protein